MKTPAQRRRQANFWLAAAVSATIGTSGVLYWFPPERYGFYPQCPFHALTGLLCPGCGVTRAMAALVHGRLGEAMHLNGLVVLLLPLLVAYGAVAYWRAIRGDGMPHIPQPAIIGLLLVAFGFGVLRNLV